MRPIRWGHVLVAAVPALFIGYFFLYPLIRILTLGLSELNIGFDGVEARLFHIGWFTLWQAVLSTVLTVVAAAPMTWAVSQFEFRGRKLATALVTVPFVLPTVVVGAAFVALGWRDSVGAILAAHIFFNIAVVVRTVGALVVTTRSRPTRCRARVGSERVEGVPDRHPAHSYDRRSPPPPPSCSCSRSPRSAWC